MKSHFTGTLNEWKDNGDKLHLEIFKTDGTRVSAEYANILNGAWASSTLLKNWSAGDGKYIFKATVEDLAGNTVLIDTQAFVIDTTLTNPDTLLAIPGSETLNVILDEGGLLEINKTTYNYTGSKLDLNQQLISQKYAYSFTDYAGNKKSGDSGSTVYTSHVVVSENTTTKPANEITDTTGEIGTYKLDTNQTTLSLGDIIRSKGSATFNAVDLNDTYSTHISITLKDLLDIGLTNGFSIESSFKDHIQFKINGEASKDTVTLSKDFQLSGTQLNLADGTVS